MGWQYDQDTHRMSTTPRPGHIAPASTLSWQGRLDSASNEAEVVAAVRDYVSELDHEELAQLPADCRPGKFLDGNDVSSFAFHLVRRQHEEPGEQPPLTKLAAFFSGASQRLSQVFQKRGAPEGSGLPT